MRASRIFKGLLLSLSLTLAATAFAANKGSLELSNSTMVAGKQLAAGNYTVQWDGAGPDVQVSILKGKQVVVTAPAKLSNVDHSPDRNEAVVNLNPDGSRSLSEIRLNGRKYVLTIGETGGGAPSGNGSSAR